METDAMGEAIARINAAQHGVQTGVAIEMGMAESGALPSDAASPKHLRVGVNSAMVFQCALAGLLIKKGLITELEYAEACADAMEKERLTYELRLRKQTGNPNIRLI